MFYIFAAIITKKIFFGVAMLKKGIALIILLSLTLLALSSCAVDGEVGEYTYRGYTSALGTNWNPHTWETSADREIMDFLTTPLVSTLPLNTEDGSYQWSYDMAESVTDVTGELYSQLLRYNVDLDGEPSESTRGYIYKITLRDGLFFEGGRPILARDFVESMRLLLEPRMKNSRANLYITGEAALAGAAEYFSGDVDFEKVGCYALDSKSFIYITKSYIDFNYFMSSLSSSWLVENQKYSEGVIATGELFSTDYNTSRETTVSYGPYRIASYQDEKEITLVRNEWWYGWERDGDGSIVSYTAGEIDGERQKQYASTRVVISVMDARTAKQAFMRGELSVWAPSADEYSLYRLSDGLYRTDETYTMSLFFNTDIEALRSMDRARGNLNSVVLSNDSFRQGISLAIDRAELCTATEGYLPEFALLNDLYYYDIYSDPTSSYRGSDEAKRAVLALYNTEYGEGTPYPTLDDAYNSITGYNLSDAKKAFLRAFDELSDSGLYSAGERIRIKVAWAKGALSSDDNQQLALINKYLNTALRGTGFGEITLEAVGQITNRYMAVPNGEYAIGYGAWGGAAFYPFRTLLVYMDPEYENLHEGACWDPSVEKLRLDIDGESVEMTWQAWARSMTGIGKYAKADVETKLEITAKLESAFLAKYYRIPLAASSSSVLLSYRTEYYTDRYNVMYGFGGFRLLKYSMDDNGWSKYVRAAGGRLRYE